MFPSVWPRLRAVTALLLFLILGAGCASVADPLEIGATRTAPVCSTLSCMTQEARGSFYESCVSSLSLYARSPTERRAIDAEYRYPFKSEDSYYQWVRMGGTGPSPQQWCRHYAARKVSGARPVMSLR